MGYKHVDYKIEIWYGASCHKEITNFKFAIILQSNERERGKKEKWSNFIYGHHSRGSRQTPSPNTQTRGPQRAHCAIVN